jgi:hypothetical protein
MQAIRKPSLALSGNKYERSVTVFNSSVENRVENAAARFKSPRHYRIYSRLHKECAIERRGKFFAKMIFECTIYFRQRRTAASGG